MAEFSNRGRDPIPDHLALQNADHLGMSLVSVPLSGENYLTWSRSMLLILRAKDKLSFINGKVETPPEESSEFEKWIKVDSMVTSWILNSISKEIMEAFLYTIYAKDL